MMKKVLSPGTRSQPMAIRSPHALLPICITLIAIALVAPVQSQYGKKTPQVAATYNEMNHYKSSSAFTSATVDGPHAHQDESGELEAPQMEPDQTKYNIELAKRVLDMNADKQQRPNGYQVNLKLGNHKNVNYMYNAAPHIWGSHVSGTQFGTPTMAAPKEGSSIWMPSPQSTNMPHGAGEELKATPQQKEVKRKLLELVDKARNEPEIYLDKIRDSIAVLSSKRLPVDRLEKILEDLKDGKLDKAVEPTAEDIPLDNGPPQEDPPREIEPDQNLEYVLFEPEPEHEPEGKDEDSLDQMRGELNDRLNLIKDSLNFRPEFMDQLLQINDDQLNPREALFKRLVLCSSDDQFCQDNPSDQPPAPEAPEAPEEVDEVPEPIVQAFRRPTCYSQSTCYSQNHVSRSQIDVGQVQPIMRGESPYVGERQASRLVFQPVVEREPLPPRQGLSGFFRDSSERQVQNTWRRQQVPSNLSQRPSESGTRMVAPQVQQRAPSPPRGQAPAAKVNWQTTRQTSMLANNLVQASRAPNELVRREPGQQRAG